MKCKNIINKMKALFISEKSFLQSSFSFNFEKKIGETVFSVLVFGLLFALMTYTSKVLGREEMFLGLSYMAWKCICIALILGAFALLLFVYRKNVKLVFKIEFILFTLLTVGILVWFTYTFVLLGDEREHLTASFFIYDGQRPYLDFFEHHHPLMWYIFLPLIWLFHNTGAIWYVMRSYSLLLIIINAIVVYKMTKLIATNKKFSWLAVFLSICSHVVFVGQITFRPDTLMSLLLMCGIYFILKYLKEKNDKFIYLAFIFFFFSFMALQKALMFLFFVAVWVLYLIYKKEISFGLVLKSLIAPVGLFLVYLFYLLQTGALKDYWELNWLLNIKARYVFTYLVAQTIWFRVANVLALYVLFTKQPLFLRYLSFLCVSFSVTLFFLGTFIQYWIPLYSLFGIISSYVICRLKDKFGVIVFAGVIASTIFNNMKYLEEQKTFPYLSFFVNLSDVVLKKTFPNDLILGNLTVIGGLRKDAAGYYWFGRDYMAVIDNHYFNRHPLPDINQIVKDKRPKIIPYTEQPGCTQKDFTNNSICKDMFVWDVDFVLKNYISTGPFLIRKDVYFSKY